MDSLRACARSQEWPISTDLVPSWLLLQSCVINLPDVQTDLESDVFTSVSLRACAQSQELPSTDRPDVIKERSHGCRSTKPHLRFVVAPANLCLACIPHLTRVESGSLLQANNQHFSPVLSTKLSYQLVSRHTEFTGQNKGPDGVLRTPWTLLVIAKKHV